MASFEWSKEAEKLWNQRANFWNSKSQEMWESGSRKDILPFFQKHVEKQAIVCDLGCGDGYGTYKFMQADYDVTGVDVSEEMIQKASSLFSSPSSTFLKGDIRDLAFEENQFDAVLAINSLEWTESPLKVIQEMKRIVKPNGRACVAILGPTAGPRENSFRRLFGEDVVCNTMMPWEFVRLAEENGWRKLDEFWVYKKDSDTVPKCSLSVQMKEALSFISIFMLENIK